MPSKELIEEIAFIIRHDRDGSPEDTARDILEVIFAALQEPTEEMRLAAAWGMDNPRSIGSEERMNAIIVAAINASPLGGQSE